MSSVRLPWAVTRVNLVSTGLFAAFFVVSWIGYGIVDGPAVLTRIPSGWPITVWLFGTLAVFNGWLSCLAGRDIWRRWRRAMAHSAGWTLPWFVAAGVSAYGFATPLWEPRMVFLHGVIRAIVWVLLGIPGGLWFLGVVTALWIDVPLTPANPVRGWHGAFWQPFSSMMAGLMFAALVGLAAWILNHLPGLSGVWKNLPWWLLILWVPVAARVGWRVSHGVTARHPNPVREVFDRATRARRLGPNE